MNYYEKVLIMDPNLDDAAVEEIVGKIKDIITKQGGEIIKVDNWGRRKLAYELNPLFLLLANLAAICASKPSPATPKKRS